MAAAGGQVGWTVGHVNASIQPAITTLATISVKKVMATTMAANASPSSSPRGKARHASMHATTNMLTRAHEATRMPGAQGQCGAVVDEIAVAVAAAMQSADGAGTGSKDAA